MKTLRNQNGFIAYIPLILVGCFVAYLVVVWGYYKIEDWNHALNVRARELAAAEARIDEQRIAKEKAVSEKQLEAIQTAYADQTEINRRLIEENAKTADRIATAHERAAGEIAKSNEKAVNMLLTWAKEGPTGQDKGLLYLLGTVALSAVLGLVAAVFFLLRGRRYPEGPIILSVDGGHQVNGRIASGGDVYKLIEHRREAVR